MNLISLKSILKYLLLLGLSQAVFAQDVLLEIDLSRNVQVSKLADPGTTFDVNVTNMSPTASYRIGISEKRNDPEPFDISLFTSGGGAVNLAANGSGTSQAIPDAFTVKKGYSYEVKVEQVKLDNGNESVEKTWIATVSGGKTGEWTISYGFNFIPNQDDLFYSMQDPTNDAQFLVTQKQDREEFDFAPSIFFHWGSEDRRKGANWLIPNMFGLGFDFEDPVVFAGWGFEVGRNVTLTFGAVAHKQARLNGKYQVGQIIETNLEQDQLAEHTYEVNGFLGISFRLGSNPFNQGGGD